VQGGVVVTLWCWDSAAGGRSGSGVTGTERQARRTAAAWMRAHQATAARVEQVTIVTGSWLGTSYQRTGRVLAGRRHPGGRVTWR
jgi:hypothetical protein